MPTTRSTVFTLPIGSWVVTFQFSLYIVYRPSWWANTQGSRCCTLWDEVYTKVQNIWGWLMIWTRHPQLPALQIVTCTSTDLKDSATSWRRSNELSRSVALRKDRRLHTIIGWIIKSPALPRYQMWTRKDHVSHPSTAILMNQHV